jgi:hypothetical protein
LILDAGEHTQYAVVQNGDIYSGNSRGVEAKLKQLRPIIQEDYRQLRLRVGSEEVPLDIYMFDPASTAQSEFGIARNYPFPGYDQKAIHLPLDETETSDSHSEQPHGTPDQSLTGFQTGFYSLFFPAALALAQRAFAAAAILALAAALTFRRLSGSASILLALTLAHRAATAMRAAWKRDFFLRPRRFRGAIGAGDSPPAMMSISP